MSSVRIAVFFVQEDTLRGLENETARRLTRHLLSEGDVTAVDFFDEGESIPKLVRDLDRCEGYDLFVLIRGAMFITSESLRALAVIAQRRKEFSVIVPVSNETKISSQQSAAPFVYQTISVFNWAVDEVYNVFKDAVTEVDDIDDFCICFRKDILKSLPEDQKVVDLPGAFKKLGLRQGVARGIYVHRYADVYESDRKDILAYIPLNARRILDVGSARGLFGKLLKQRQECFVTGIEIDTGLNEIARGRLDEVLLGNIEDIVDRDTLGAYDCIVCSDVLEHLNDPWKVVKGLKKCLANGGLLIASSPNIANWAIIHEMLKGKWEYVPFSILSGTHIRFFTRDMFMNLFEEAGYKIRKVLLQTFDLPPKGAEFIAGLKTANKINEEELRASEILIVAEG
jgi:2-polyprenyl-3-methyl-5-hydroxy-6-metoxy-1,4-benzoquinol methylase